MLRARGDEPFAFEAPDESFGFSVARTGGWQAVGMTAGAIRQIDARWASIAMLSTTGLLPTRAGRSW
jgi:hypothetical protein